MKVTIFALHLGYGGAEKYVSTIANILSSQHEVEIISTYCTTDYPAFEITDKVKVRYLTKVRPNAQSIKQAIEKKNVELIVREGFIAADVLIKKYVSNVLAIKRCDADVIISTRIFHNRLIKKFARREVIKIATEHNHPCGNNKYIRSLVKSIESFDYLLPISKELTTFYETHSDVNARVLYLPFCIDKHIPTVNERFGDPIFVSVGRLSPEKGYIDLICVFEGIVERIPNAILHIVGDGSEKAQIENKIQECGLGNNVILHGFLEKGDVYEVLDASTLYLMTSYTESFGIVLLEAMSSGLPCVAFDSAQGAHEIIENQKNGFLISNRSIPQFVDMVCDLLETPEILNDMRQAAFETAEKYSYKSTECAWLNFFNEM